MVRYKRNKNNKRVGEIIRFIIVGGIASIIQYGVYLLMLHYSRPLIANTVAYIISFIFNYFASTYFTFRVKSNKQRGLGFLFAHIINYIMQSFWLKVFLWLGLPKNIAFIPMLCICVPINFLIVRFFLKKKYS